MNDLIIISHDPLKVDELILWTQDKSCGAIANFIGITRDNEGGK